MDDKNVVKKRVTLAIAFAVFLLAVIVIIVLIKPVIFKVKDNNRAEVSEQTQKEAEEYLKVYYRSLANVTVRRTVCSEISCRCLQ